MTEVVFKELAGVVALAIEASVVLVIAIGTVQALARTALRSFDGAAAMTRRAIWLDYAVWILLALEFALAADIIRTAIAPSWDDIGKLAAIAAIRTALNFFLARDIGDYRRAEKGTPD